MMKKTLSNIGVMKYDDGLFFILSSVSWNGNHINVYDRSGKYLHDIGFRGRTANEYVSIDCWTINPYSNEVVIYGNNNYWTCFPDGTLLLCCMMHRLDNHIYHLCGTDSQECIANMAFLPEIPKRRNLHCIP